mmetsp:Transcript_24913/g.37280  ORF Transcript_24913/g.37280 Transcript_24913/m.37280 type:complete len:93 (+) Transcript_24913:974-1252(+)
MPLNNTSTMPCRWQLHHPTDDNLHCLNCAYLFWSVNKLKMIAKYYYADKIDSNRNQPLHDCDEIESLYTVVILDGFQQMEELSCPDNGSRLQ